MRCLSSPSTPTEHLAQLFRWGTATALREAFDPVHDSKSFCKSLGLLHDVSGGPAVLDALDTSFNSQLSFSQFLKPVVDYASDFLLVHEERGNRYFPLDPADWKVSRKECKGIVANAFLGNIVGDPVALSKPSNLPADGGLNFWKMFESDENLAVEKIRCLIQYLANSDDELDDGNDVVHFHKEKLSMDTFVDLPGWDIPIDIGLVDEVTTLGMEQERANAMINFANAVYGFGCFLGDSCTQEEILQMCCPEINVGMLMYGTMNSDEAIIVHNVRRYCDYKGYSSSFTFAGPSAMTGTQSIVFMDAVSVMSDPLNQFTYSLQLRDIGKAFLGFSGACTSGRDAQDERIIISTGKWGCGAFGGNPYLKFLQQVVAIALVNATTVIPFDAQRQSDNGAEAKASLLFSAYRNEKLRDDLRLLHEACVDLTPRDLLDQVMSREELFRTTRTLQPPSA